MNAAAPAVGARAQRRIALPAADPLAALLLLAGAAAVLPLPEAPESTPLALACAAAVLALLWRPRARLVLLPLFAAMWTLLAGRIALDHRLPPALHGVDLRIEGTLVELPDAGPGQVRFDFVVDAGEGDAAVLIGRRVRLGWYAQPPPVLAPGERWRLTVRLKRPRGVQNPGGFDYERHALLHEVAATGYVRDAPAPARIADAAGVDAVRARISAAIAAQVGARDARFLQGLAVGDTRAFDGADWDVLRATGLTHLFAISGLHIALVAACGAWLVRLAYRLRPQWGLRVPRPQALAFAALLFAFGYSALAGFGLATVRSLLMIAAALLAVLVRRPPDAVQSLAFAAIAAWLFEPLAVLSAGFWLSLVGVAWLLLLVPEARGAATPGQAVRGAARGLLAAQWAMTIGLLPLTVFCFGQASLAGALLNLVAVPLISLVVVPLTLLGTASLPLAFVADVPLECAAWLMRQLWRLAEAIAAWPHAQLWLAEAAWPALLCALAGAGWMLLPRGVPGKPLAALLFAPLLWPASASLAEGELEVTLLDVGQGLAVLMRTAEGAWLYDAGPAYAGGLDLGEAAVLPALRALGVARLDGIVLSHGDNDHAGGAAAVRRGYPEAPVFSGEPVARIDAQRCVAGMQWRSAGVAFRLLHPPAEFPALRNDSSCVVRVDAAGGSVLLTGDIGAAIEQRLVAADAAALRADVVVVPHHGSRHSSTAAFVAAVAPQLALIPAPLHSRFGHPHADVVARWRGSGAALLDSGRSGMVTVILRHDGVLDVMQRRASHRRFWHEPGGSAVVAHSRASRAGSRAYRRALRSDARDGSVTLWRMYAGTARGRDAGLWPCDRAQGMPGNVFRRALPHRPVERVSRPPMPSSMRPASCAAIRRR